MTNRTKWNVEEHESRHRDSYKLNSLGYLTMLTRIGRALAIFVACSAVAVAQGDGPAQLRRFIDQQVGGIEKLKVPVHDSDIPQPRLANGSPDPSFKTTEAKRFLGKMLFFDPVRT